MGPDTTVDEVLEGVELDGTTALITGASAGLGLETARVLSAHGASLILGVRDITKAENALAGAGVDPTTYELRDVDLADLASVRSFTDGVVADRDRIDVLIANAGVLACTQGTTADGFELHFGTNHLGHFALVNCLVPVVEAAAPARIVLLTSGAHRWADVDLDDPGFERTPYNPYLAYGRSKTANVLFAVELDRRLRDRGVRVTAVNPGSVVTELNRHVTEEMRQALTGRVGAINFAVKKAVGAGATTSVWAGVVADADVIGGRYCEDCGVAEISNDRTSATGVSAYAVDPDRAAALWARSEELVGKRFG